MSIIKEALEVFATSRSRKQLEKDLAKVRDKFHKSKNDYDVNSAQLKALQEKTDVAHNDMNSARDSMVALNDKLQTMDLTGANAVRERGNDCSYIIDGKEFHVSKKDQNNVEMVPWKKHKKDKEMQQEADDANIAEAFKETFKLVK